MSNIPDYQKEDFLFALLSPQQEISEGVKTLKTPEPLKWLHQFLFVVPPYHHQILKSFS